MSSGPSLYHYPHLYFQLLQPESRDLYQVMNWTRKYLSGSFKRVLDPACGPGNWLLPFARLGKFVGGNDIEPRMITGAKKELQDFRHELVVGDMRTLHFESGLFDLAVNFDGSIGHLSSDDEVLEHLISVASCLRVGGLYLVGLMLIEETSKMDDIPLYQSGKIQLKEGGEARVSYETLACLPKERVERIQVTVETWNSRYPRYFQETYDLMTFSSEQLTNLINSASGFQVRAVHLMDLEGFPTCDLGKASGDLTLILEKVG